MSQAGSPPEYIFKGVWVNQNRGQVLGSTLTVDPYAASLLTPAIALLISIAGSQLWRLFQFALHQARATSENRQLLYHQQQVILRNTGNDLNTIYRLIRTAFAWRHQEGARVFRRSLPLVLWSTLHFSIIVLAGLFSTWLLEAGDDVLSRSQFCGTFSQSYIDSLDAVSTSNLTDQGITLMQEYTHYHNARYVYVQQHVDICRNGENGTEGCDMMPVGSLGWKGRVLPSSCPFDQDMCHPSLEGALSLDTGYLSSHLDLGFNAPKKDRIAFRLSAQCAPLNDAKYGTGWQNVSATNGVPAREIADVYYGPSSLNSRNATFSQTRQYMDCDQRIAAPAYLLDSVFAVAGGSIATGDANFDPIHDLQRTDADTSLISLVSNSLYTAPVLDPWFSAQDQILDTNAFCLGDNRTVYGRELPITTMGCTQQWQLCNTEEPGSNADEQCTTPMGLDYLQDYLATPQRDINFNHRQIASAKRVVASAMSSSFYYVINALASSNGQLVKAASQMAANTGPALPAGQWQIEAQNWMSILMGVLQQTSLDFGTGQFAASTSYINATEKVYKASPHDPEIVAAQWLCQNQVIHSKVYRNYNFFALMMLVIVCSILIVLGLCIEDLVGYVRQKNLRHSGKNGKQGMWNTNSDLEMLKTIDEIRNYSTWGISRNGIWLGPPGYQVSINDLKAENQEVESGTGFIPRAVKRHQTQRNQSPTCPCKRGTPHCRTCSSSDSSSTVGSVQKDTPTQEPIATNPVYLAFQNYFRTDFDRTIS